MTELIVGACMLIGLALALEGSLFGGVLSIGSVCFLFDDLMRTIFHP